MVSNNKGSLQGAGILLLFLVLAVGSCLYGFDPLATTACDKFGGDQRDHCIKGIATRTNKLNLCDSIDVTQPSRMECYTSIAEKRNDMAICDKVRGGMFAESRIGCLERVGIKNNNPKACEAMGTETESRVGIVTSKENCLKAIANNAAYAQAQQETQQTAEPIKGTQCTFSDDCKNQPGFGTCADSRNKVRYDCNNGNCVRQDFNCPGDCKDGQCQ